MFIVPFLLLDPRMLNSDDWQDHFSITLDRVECAVEEFEEPGNRGPRLYSPQEIVLIEERRKAVAAKDRKQEQERRKRKATA